MHFKAWFFWAGVDRCRKEIFHAKQKLHLRKCIKGVAVLRREIETGMDGCPDSNRGSAKSNNLLLRSSLIGCCFGFAFRFKRFVTSSPILQKISYTTARFNTGMQANLYFLWDSNGTEIDLLLSSGQKLYPMAIKSSRTWHSDFDKHIRRFMKWTDRFGQVTVIYAVDGISIVNFRRTSSMM